MIETVTTSQAILIAIIGMITLGTDLYTLFRLSRALQICALVGLILGHATEGLMLGAAAELIYLGLINAAGVLPPHPLGVGTFGTIFYLTNPAGGVGAAIALSLPISIFIQFLTTLSFTFLSPISKAMESSIKKERWILYRIYGHSTAITWATFGFIVGLAAGLGAASFSEQVAKMPMWFQSGLSIGGRMLPAMGFAVVLKLMLKKEYIPFLFVGFALLVIFKGVGAAKPEWGFNLITLGIAAAAIAVVVFFSGKLSQQENKKRVEAGGSDGI